jgi:hypothetical protein
LSGTIADMSIRRCPACGGIYVEDDRMYLDTDRCPACGVCVLERPVLFGIGGRSASGRVPAGAWELEDGSGHWELEDGSGYWEGES